MNTSIAKIIVCICMATLACQESFSQTTSKTTMDLETKTSTTVSNAKDPYSLFQAGIIPVDVNQSKIRVWFNNPAKKKISVFITDKVGFAWSENYYDSVYRKTFDLSSLDDGKYYITITSGREKIKKTIIISSNTITTRNIAVN